MNKKLAFSQLRFLGIFLLMGISLTIVYFLVSTVLSGVWSGIFFIVTPQILKIASIFYSIHLFFKSTFFTGYKLAGAILLSTCLVSLTSYLLLGSQNSLHASFVPQKTCSELVQLIAPSFLDFLPCLLKTSLYLIFLSVAIGYVPIVITKNLIYWKSKLIK